ncbi:hypothetical protein A2Z00_03125 [Candidatus Gottesmanbacteria bacterium RBG_13_45_10]|uniref:Peptidase M24 domain-containing protein n=1 Tax=Candidatus Gottesmanbacteria bacterium RBG_13_45_10 TaxID=1798370 RepID=A0A1F5ZGH6_9BACT|nr:MAG: hypothetical protein A2Z00_03125 [Candidatus Gottesmanbacteria bacterium RBG_13_45_10]
MESPKGFNAIKRDDEITNMRRAAKLTDQCYAYIVPRIKPGVTEEEIARDIETFIKNQHAELAFPVIVAFGKNTSIVHHLKASRYVKCRKQEIVLLDFGAKAAGGYCSDMTRMVFIGKPKEKWKRAYQTVLEAQTLAIHFLDSCYHVTVHDSRISGVSGAKLDVMVREYIERAGFPPYPHSLGHCLGKEIHELPRLSRNKDAQITPGMVFTIEPGIYIKGDYGIRIEDTVCLKSDGLDIFTRSSKELTIV